MNRKPDTVRTGTVRESVWYALKTKRELSAEDLARITGGGKENIRRYLYALYKAGYLERFGGWGAIYRLKRDTGLFPPVVKRITQIYDPNTGERIELCKGRAD